MSARAQVGVTLPSDVTFQQLQVKVAREQLVRALAENRPDNPDPQKLDDALRGWATTNAEVDEYLTEEPSLFSAASQLQHGQKLESDIAAWRRVFLGLGFNVPEAPARSAPLDVADFFSGAGSLLLLAGAVLLLAQRR